MLLEKTKRTSVTEKYEISNIGEVEEPFILRFPKLNTAEKGNRSFAEIAQTLTWTLEVILGKSKTEGLLIKLVAFMRPMSFLQMGMVLMIFFICIRPIMVF